MIKESHHLAITDLPYLLSSELSLIKKLDRNNNILELTRIHLEISNLALSDV
jgi:hypothetical protein